MSADRFAQRKAAQGYRSPGMRDGCWNCCHRSADAFTFTDERRIAYDCTLGKFLVAPQGICDRHTPAGIARAHPATSNSNTMKSYEQIAEAMFKAFLEERKACGSTSTDYIKWSGLSTDGQDCWIAAANRAVAELALGTGYEQVAEAAYGAFFKSTEARGGSCIPWIAMTSGNRGCWIAAAQQAAAELALVH